MKSILILLSISSLIFISSCKKKKVQCDHGEVCVKNIGSDTIYYSWGGSQMDKYILPGETTCTQTQEEIYITRNEESFSTIYFETIGHGSYAIKVKECKVNREVK